MLAYTIPSFSTAEVIEIGLFILTLALFIITAWQAHLTQQNVTAAKDSVNATNKLVELQTEPLVYIGARWERKVITPNPRYIQPPRFELVVFIQNTWGGPARNIKIADVSDDFPAGIFLVNSEPTVLSFKQSPVGKGEAIKELSPGQEIPLARMTRAELSALKRSAEVKFTYENLQGKSRPESSFLAFPSYGNSSLPIDATLS